MANCIKDYPYSVLSLKRRKPNKNKNSEATILKYTYEVTQKFEYVFWDIDEALI